MRNKLILCGTVAALSACSTIGTYGDKAYDNAVLVVVTENALLIPTTIDKDFIKLIGDRLNKFTALEFERLGRLQLTDKCGPRTLKVTQEVSGLTISGLTQSTAGGFFKPSVTTSKNDEVRATIDLTVQDCETGKKFRTYSYTHSGKDPAQVLKDFAGWNAGYAHRHQNAQAQ